MEMNGNGNTQPLQLIFSAYELKERKLDFERQCAAALRQKMEKERKLALPVLKQLISEFNRKAENTYEDNFVVLDETPIPYNLKSKHIIEFIDELFSEKGFLISQTVIGGRTFIKVSWEWNVEKNTDEAETGLESIIRKWIREELNLKSNKNLKN